MNKFTSIRLGINPDGTFRDSRIFFSIFSFERLPKKKKIGKTLREIFESLTV